MNEEMMVMEEETTAVVEDAEITELATVEGVEVGEVVETTNDGVNPVVAAGIGLGITGLVGGLTYLFLKKKKRRLPKIDEGEPKSNGSSTNKKPTSEAELNEYLEKLLEETAEVNKRIMELKSKESEDEKKGNEE